jgi:hypothetical protein
VFEFPPQFLATIEVVIASFTSILLLFVGDMMSVIVAVHALIAAGFYAASILICVLFVRYLQDTLNSAGFQAFASYGPG